ncbi:tubulin folding cofactor A [Didymosphaeria variabile]|uniref:Tubulin-specific chaperone A n=1 Tax=Didymosphaeria variabile TaxID=1932322 RepID=A0A9W9C623_9PLEO|nr:tubulin folding cofactor A [Didymosphaeria variabile]KAJ4347105.1 tubulin folding cofactor A [Didymosphaeria variabile]
MPPPSKLAVATSSLARLVKEEASYYKEMEQQEARIKKLEAGSDEDNAEYLLKQEKQGLEETKNVIPNVRSKIRDALEKLEEQLESNKEAGGEASTEQVTKAKEAIEKAKVALRESA